MGNPNTIQDYGPILTYITIGFAVPAIIIYIWRIASRLVKSNRVGGFGMDDLMLTFAMISAICGISFGLSSVKYGFGKHGADLTTKNKHNALFYFWIYQIEYKFMVCFAKLSMLFFYIRLFQADPVFYFCTKYFMAFIVLASTAFIFSNIFMCLPVKAAWNKTVKGHCINNEAFWISHAVFHIVTDLTIFLMPIAPVRKLRMSKSRKFAVECAFGLGSLVCIADAVRIYYLWVSAKSTDPTYGASMAVILTTIVSFLAIMSISMITGLKGSINMCYNRLKHRNRSAYELYHYDIPSQNLSLREDEVWHSTQIRTTINRSDREMPALDGSRDPSIPKAFRVERDIIRKTTVTVEGTSS